MIDMLKTVEPKTDQLNADSLVGGPITVTITGVSGNDSAEQPVSIHYDGENGRPFKPCKSMRRVFVTVWGPDAKQYVGRSLTLYCDPNVQFGGMKVGGIRISHMSHIDKPQTMALTATRAKRAPFTVQPLVVEKAASAAVTTKLTAEQVTAHLSAINSVDGMVDLADVFAKAWKAASEAKDAEARGKFKTAYDSVKTLLEDTEHKAETL